MSLELVWFLIWGSLWAGYFMLDGYDFGVGASFRWISRDPAERNRLIATIGPHWGANTVWLITAGAGTFAAFPVVYGTLFSSYYVPVILLLFALILRGVSIEFRVMLDEPRWQALWNWALFIGSVLPSILFGAVFGNLFAGVPLGPDGFEGGVFAAINPYAVMTGLLLLALFWVHGTLWAALKTDGALRERAGDFARKGWYAAIALTAIFLAWTAAGTRLFVPLLESPVLLVLPLIAAAGFAGTYVFLRGRRYGPAFAASSTGIGFLVFTGLAGMYPALIPSSIDPAYSLTVENAASSPYTLVVMTVIAGIMVPIIGAYTVWAYYKFRGPTPESHGEAESGY